uniref:L(3)mbtlike 2 (Drosophila) [Danio rerio] n=1 Tax=Lepeophtheirus salmonis TaxID=72036 RepID=A0A0K2UZR8_LEPSM
MPYACAAPGCVVGQPWRKISPNVSTHRFPTDPTRRRKWIDAIKKVRDNWDFDEYSKKVGGLCSLHFQPGDFTYESRDSNSSRRKKEIKDGKVKKPRLKREAVPSFSSNLPTSSSTATSTYFIKESKRVESPKGLRDPLTLLESPNKTKVEAKKIPSFATFSSLLKEGNISLPNGFKVFQMKPKIIDILKFCESQTGLPVVERGITINEDLSFKAFLHSSIVPPHPFKHLVKKDGILEETLQIPCILSLLQDIEMDKEECLIKEALYILEKKVKEAVLPEEKKAKLKFAIEQGNLALRDIKYSPGFHKQLL